MSDVKTTIETITPSRAKTMLHDNPSNRRIDARSVANLVRDLERGRWQFNGDAIRFDEHGALIDGQHRLKACVTADVSIKTIVLRGLPNDVRKTIDSGAKRTTGSRFQMEGIKNANATAAAIAVLFQIAHQDTGAFCTPGEALEVLEKHPCIPVSVSFCYQAFPGIGSRLAALHYIGGYIGEREIADRFIDVWASGSPSYQGDAAHSARERLIRTRGTTGQLTSQNIARIVLHSFNLFRARKSVRAVKAPDHYLIRGWDAGTLFDPSFAPSVSNLRTAEREYL